MKKLLLSILLGALLSNAAVVSITGVSCSNQVVTVSCTTCGIAKYQGFSIQGTSVTAYNLNGTAATASANAFTFTLPASTPCAGSATGGTVQPAKQIINVASVASGNGTITITYISWYTTLTPVPIPGAVSTWSGASAAENAAIAAGTTIEVPGSVSVSPNASTATISANLIAQYNAVQASYSSGFLAYAGYWYNGTAWVNQ
jgi:hypothetical protein